jgi:hypothetical protein
VHRHAQPVSSSEEAMLLLYLMEPINLCVLSICMTVFNTQSFSCLCLWLKPMVKYFINSGRCRYLLLLHDIPVPCLHVVGVVFSLDNSRHRFLSLGNYGTSPGQRLTARPQTLDDTGWKFIEGGHWAITTTPTPHTTSPARERATCHFRTAIGYQKFHKTSSSCYTQLCTRPTTATPTAVATTWGFAECQTIGCPSICKACPPLMIYSLHIGIVL